MKHLKSHANFMEKHEQNNYLYEANWIFFFLPTHMVMLSVLSYRKQFSEGKWYNLKCVSLTSSHQPSKYPGKCLNFSSCFWFLKSLITEYTNLYDFYGQK